MTYHTSPLPEPAPSVELPSTLTHIASEGSGTLPERPLHRRIVFKISPAAAVVAGVLIVGSLLGGVEIGQATAPTRPECKAALGYSEQALKDSGEAFDAISSGLGGGLYGIASISGKLDPITADIKKVTPLYQTAKDGCLK